MKNSEGESKIHTYIKDQKLFRFHNALQKIMIVLKVLKLKIQNVFNNVLEYYLQAIVKRVLKIG